jgi:hypothetical protein
MLRGHRCRVCDALGEHLTSACPKRHAIGLPQRIVDVPAPKHAQLTSAELLTAVHDHADVPEALRCCGCWLLSTDPVWLPCCDAVACLGCLGPMELPWTCPACHCALHDGDVHVVGALRSLAAATFQTLAAAVEPVVSITDSRGPRRAAQRHAKRRGAKPPAAPHPG